MQTVRAMMTALARGETTSRRLTEDCLAAIAAQNPAINAFIHCDHEAALAAADRADARIAAGQGGPLTGIPLALKDIFCVKGTPTTCASKMLAQFIAPYNATVAHRLLDDSGMVLLGKCNMDEFAMGSSNENSAFGPVKNPWDLTRVPGGSSGGSAAAVAAAMAPIALGTDTGGSIRQPAAFCGVTGIKPTYGRVSRYGMIAYASSLDQAGIVAQTAEDAAYLLQAMAGFDERDSTSVDRSVPDWPQLLDQPLAGLRLGVPEAWFGRGLDPAVRQVTEAAIDTLVAEGARCVPISLPHSDLAIASYYVIATSEASSNLARYDGVRYGHRAAGANTIDELYRQSRGQAFGAEVKRRILVGTYALSAGYYDAYYLQAQKIRRLISDDFSAAFTEVDLIVGPVTPTPAFRLGEKTDDATQMYLADIYTLPLNLAGLPGMSIPAGFVDGLPVGLQLIGNYWQEDKLLAAAHAFQQVSDWHSRKPTPHA